ncbi:MAG: hypothetical protein FIA95_04905 [Gemmatimonadetes bacterium]|nr:hypothetical protein [Gemmatimonadota bacterium]
MRRPYLAYLLAVVLPAALTAAVGLLLARDGRREIAETSQVRVGRMALNAQAEDQAAGRPPSTAQVARAAGYRAALYVSGRLVASTDPPPAPPGVDGSILVPAAGTGAAATHAVIVAPQEPAGRSLPLPLLLVTGLLFLFASLAGWIQLAARPAGGRALSVLLLSALPALTAWGFLVQADRLHREAAEAAARRDLTRALAVARLRGVAGEPREVHRLTGYHAWRVRAGAVEAASLEGPAGAVAALPAPPPSFTSTGSLETPEGEAPYVALRLPGGGFTVAAEVPPSRRGERFSRNAARAALALAAWLLLAGAAAAAGKARISSGR